MATNQILAGIANPFVADVVGAQQERADRQFLLGQRNQLQQEQEQKRNAQQLAGNILSEQLGGQDTQLGQLAGQDVGLAQELSQVMGVSLDDSGAFQQFGNDILTADTMFESGNFDGGFQILDQAKKRALAAGRPTTQIDAFFTGVQQNPEAAFETLGTIAEGFRRLGSNDDKSTIQQAKFIPGVGFAQQKSTGEVDLVQFTPEQQQLMARADKRQIDLAAEKAARTTGARVSEKGAGGRTQEAIGFGLDAAKGIPILRRSLSLLDTVKTGGFQNLALQAQNMFGITGGDELELSTNLGRNVLSQLKTIFGAQFTEKEGARLEGIEAGFGKSSAGNRRLLRQAMLVAEDAANRGLKAAISSEDYETAATIKDLLKGNFDITDERLESVEVSPQQSQALDGLTTQDLQGLSDEQLQQLLAQ